MKAEHAGKSRASTAHGADQDPRKAATLGEACRNEDGIFNGIKLLSWLSEALSPGHGIPEAEVRRMAQDAIDQRKRMGIKGGDGDRQEG